MHRTQSIDYGIVIWGELELELDGGDKTTLGPSDVCVQRGTNHLWRNTSDKWTRVAYILLDAQPIIINGEKLPDEGFTGDQSGDHH
jgi:quercetin dioxygenase-like cupin family protein